MRVVAIKTMALWWKFDPDELDEVKTRFFRDSEDDSVKVTDWGIIRITDSSKTTSGVWGTPSYISPEQRAGKKIDAQSDLFSLGVTLYRLCCGRPAFIGESMPQLIFKITREPSIDPVSLNPTRRDCLADTIHNAVAKNQEERYRTGEEMARAILECSTELSAVDVGL